MQQALLTQDRLIASGQIIATGDRTAEEAAIKTAKENKARDEIENLEKPWLDREDIENLEEVFKKEGHEAFSSSYDELVDKKQGAAKKKILQKLDNTDK